jgi:hypothetical protein
VAYVSLNVASANVTAGQTYLVDDVWLSKQTTGRLLVNGAIDGQTITGAVVQSASSGARMRMENDAAGGVLKFFGGVSGETVGYLNPTSNGVTLRAPSNPTAPNPPIITLASATSGLESVTVTASRLFVGNVYVTPSGSSTATANASGQVVITHGMGTTPGRIMLQSNTNNRILTVTAKNATTFTVTGCVGTTNVVVGSGSNMAFDWVAFG